MQRQVPFNLYDVFARAPFCGNQAGVIRTRAEVSDEQLLLMAREFQLPEIALSRISQTNLYLRFANADRIMTRCGHATVAAVADFVLKRTPRTRNWQWGRYIVGESRALWKARVLSPRSTEVEISWPDSPNKVAPLALGEICRALNLKRSAIDSRLPMGIYSSGQTHALVPVVSETLLNRIEPIWTVLDRMFLNSSLTDMHLYHVTSVDPTRGLVRARCRNIFPYGVREESATGTASIALAGAFLSHVESRFRSQPSGLRFAFEQGRQDRMGHLNVSWRPGNSAQPAFWLGGRVYQTVRGQLQHLPAA